MTVYITQHGNLAGFQRTGMLSNPLAAVGLTSAAVSTMASGAEYVRVSADGGSYVSFIGSTASGALVGSSTVALAASNALRIPPNVDPAVLAVPQGATKLICAST